jgi:tetratricopeptide (TPR) repeat protein
MPDSFFGRLKKAIAAPQAPAHHLQYRSVIPLRTRIWNAIQPPKATPSNRKPLNRGQKRLLIISLIMIVPIATTWGIISYVSSAPERSAKSFQEGVTLMGSGNTDLAIKRFNDAISTWPGNARAFLERGNAFVLSNLPDQAKRDWTTAIQLDPSLAPAYIARGTQYRVEGNTTKALEDLEHGLRIQPSVDGYYQRGQIYNGQGQFAKAIESYDLAIATMRDAPYVYRARATARKALGDGSGYDQDRDTANHLEHH